MSRKAVELMIGRLATDEEFRWRFADDREAVLDGAIAEGLSLTPAEREAFLDIDSDACEGFAQRLDARLQKISLRRRPS